MSRSSEAPLRPDSPLPVGPLNLMTFAMGGTPRAGSWHHMAWLSFIELDKAVVHVIRVASFV